MIRVALVTNWMEKCGNAEYALNLFRHVDHSKVALGIIDRPLTFENIYQRTRYADVIHFNCVFPEFRSIATEVWPWRRFKDGGKHLTITVQDSSQRKVEKTAELAMEDGSPVFDLVAVHQETQGAPYKDNVRVIPHGILQVDVSDVMPQQKIGTAGFPMPWKGHVPGAYAAAKLGLGYLAIMPASHHIDVKQTKDKVLEICPWAEVVTDWLDHKSIIRRLAECFVTQFAYDTEYLHSTPEGISGAVRFGIAAQRPVIVSGNILFKDLFSRGDEIYFTDHGLENTIVEVAKDWNNGKAKVPRKLLEEMNWTACARMYEKMWVDSTSCAAGSYKSRKAPD